MQAGRDMVEVTLPGGFSDGGGWRRTLWLRPWNGGDELEMFGDGGDAPAAQATALLARCVSQEDGGPPASAAFVRGLTAGDREALLLHLRRITLGDALPCLLDCSACGAKVELELSTRALLLPPYGWEGRWHALPATGGVPALGFRLPTGADQEAVSRIAQEDPDASVRFLAARCLRPGAADGAERSSPGNDGEGESGATSPPEALALTGEAAPALLDRLAEAMAALDPQAEVRIDFDCPDCGHPSGVLLDAFTYIRAEAVRSRRRLQRDVHLLALHYHWSEPEITGLSPRQRRGYIEHLLEALDAEAIA